MSSIERLIEKYAEYVRLPWERTLAGPQRVWFAIYEPAQERRLRLRIAEFEQATKASGHGWLLLDLTDSFAHWMAGHEYREAYFEEPEDMELALQDFGDQVVEQLKQALADPAADDNAVVAVAGVASLFGLARMSVVLDRVASEVKGRLLVFFPGQREGSNYRLLDARDGWNYLAVPITADDWS